MKLALALAGLLLVSGCAVRRPATAGAQAVQPEDVPRGSQDWRWVQGAVFVPTNCVNEAQEWDEYDPVVNERELGYASVYGINVVRVYLHYFVYLKKKAALLSDIEDFLRRADSHGIRVEFVFFDDCWNQPPEELLSADYRYPPPIPGVHNSRWLVCPGDAVRNNYYRHKAGLKAYVQDVVDAHRADPRVVFWEIYNEPNKSEATVRLERDAMGWIKETGTQIPVTATDREFSGGPFSDFYSWHEYGAYDVLGDSHSLCTECMNRQGQSVPGIVEHFRGKVGYIMWELGIGRDNCRFAWANDRAHPRSDEPAAPFHGIVYPDGHPWSLDDARALLGPEKYLATPFFRVRYYRDASFGALAKTSVVPSIDYDLVDEEGVGSPDASAGVPRRDFSVAYDGTIRPSADALYTFSVESDGSAEVTIDGALVVRKDGGAPGTAQGSVSLSPDKRHRIEVRYAHASGPASLHVLWSGPGMPSRPIRPASHPAGV